MQKIVQKIKSGCAKKGSAAMPFFQPKLIIGNTNDGYEQEADAMAKKVMEPVAAKKGSSFFQSGLKSDTGIQRKCSACNEKENIQLKGGNLVAGATAAPAIVHNAIHADGNALDTNTRGFMETKFGYNFGNVRVHNNDLAHQSSSQINALAYTHGNHVVFGAGQYQPNTNEGRQLLAHELTHVVQQSATGGVIQRQAARPKQADYETLVKQGKWCRDSAESGKLHPGLQCYREIPVASGYPSAQQYCFKIETGEYAEESPDFISAVSGQHKDGTCDIPMGIKDPPNPATQRGRRALGHLISDIATEDADMIGESFGLASGISMGIGLPKDGFGLGSIAIPAILGSMGFYLGRKGLPLLNHFAQKHGFLPTISLSGGSNLSLGLGIGLEKRDRPLPLIPVNSYLSFGIDTTLGYTEDTGIDSSIMAKVGIRFDPGKQGGLFGIATAGAGLRVGKGADAVGSLGAGIGYRATDFMDVQIVRESITGDDERGGTYWLTLKLVAPQRVLKGH